jgi:hypothetical protein
MTYRLKKVGEPRCGDSGGMSMAIYAVDQYGQVVADRNKAVNVKYEDNASPRVGAVMRVGSQFARTYQDQDWWQTTRIEQILEEKKNDNGNVVYCKFRTLNSTYEWWND